MVKSIISSFDKFLEEFPLIASEKSQRLNSLKRYFARGGVVSVAKKRGRWPKLLYPNSGRISDQINDLDSLKKQFSDERKNWDKTFLLAKAYELKHKVLKFSDPLYWQHLSKIVLDPDYRDDVSTVKLPAHLVKDPRWKPMVKMFVNDYDYRKQLVDTVEKSIAYKQDKRVAKYAKELVKFRADVSAQKSNGLKEKISGLNEDIKMFREMLKWAKK